MQYSANLSPSAHAFPLQSPPSYARAPQQYPASMQPVVNLPRPSSPLASPTANKTMSAHPLLTPSGRAFASGGKVQNISSDPLSPCIMYWPDNEPFPEQGQIRPSGLMGVPQPGDWICLKCNYLNWRRRKVCQTRRGQWGFDFRAHTFGQHYFELPFLVGIQPKTQHYEENPLAEARSRVQTT
ncbi:hypothetical protein FB451DRAFT_1368880 [Mycena latifolia]|nr:hypothetical protein FB451DRAFT_1368880 [Mycena latifolia]